MPPLNPNDVVPALRNNLAFSHPPYGLGAGFLSVRNVSNGEVFRLRGFEYSLARMLDGRRTATQLVEAAGQLGLPVTLADLEGFLRKLGERHLVTPTATPREKDELPPFQGRVRWDEKTRQLFRFALREGRVGNLNRALVGLDCLLHERPQTEEALQLRERLELRLQAPDRVEPFRTAFAEAERDWLEEEAVEPVDSAARRRRVGLIASGTFFALGVLAMAASLVPFPHEVIRQATLFPIASAKVTAPRTGRIAAVPVAVGQWVEKDTVLYTYDVTAQLRQLEAAVARLDQLNRGLHHHLPQTKEVQDARARYVRADAKLAVAQSSLERERTRDGNRLPEAEETLNWALKEITDARAALDEQVPEEDRALLRAQRSQVQELEMQLLESEVKAPISGAITMLAVRPGAEVVQGLGLVQLDDSRQLKGIAWVEPREQRGLEPGQPVLLLSNGRATLTTIAQTWGRNVEILIDNPARTFQPGPAQMQIRGKPVPLIR
ncbi:MAG: Barrel-sandwich domain of CusB or HlyD rane-fusion [Myxococcaceae bacterium]|nr:Barrel-sandwich domain of CusB or HlyD rane-fusion [Myxococcaceae bacterium]